MPEKVHGAAAKPSAMPPKDKPPVPRPGFPKAPAQRIAIACLALAVFDAVLGQKTLAMVFAAVAIAISLGSGLLARATRKSGKGR